MRKGMRTISFMASMALLGIGTFLTLDKCLLPDMASAQLAQRTCLTKSSRKLRKNPTIENALLVEGASEKYLGAMYLTSFQYSEFQRKFLWRNNFLNNPNSIIKNLKKVDYDPYIVGLMVEMMQDKSELSRDIAKHGPYDAQVRAKMVEKWGPKLNDYIRKRN